MGQIITALVAGAVELVVLSSVVSGLFGLMPRGL
jgi:hypothetical protein